ncbi:hypothetical protein SEUCBS139899_006201 [Sporothrix eucalyptigena]|uniref:Uncharacterized protein n=1 Tax=Sporothrix eucalyptigena TaxID=1812306 RepID=A0ABP0AS68_9PEZI
MGTKHLTEADRLRARTLFFDAGLPKARICQITGFSLNQVKLAIREKTPKTRSGRPPRRRPVTGATVAAAGGLPGSEVPLAAGEHGHGEHSEHGEDSVLNVPHSTAVTASPAMGGPAAAPAAVPGTVHRQGDRMPPLHVSEQQQRQQHQDQHHQQQQHEQHRGHHQGHPQMKWETGYPPQQPYYSSWPPPAPTPVSPRSTIAAGAGFGPRGSLTPASPPLPPPTTTSMRMLPTTVGPLGIPSPSASSVAGSIRGRGDGGSISSSVGRRSDGHDFSSSSTASSLASSATSYSSSSGGGFSLPSILASATGP